MPAHLEWSNFSTAWTQGNIGTGMRNSGIIATGTIIGVCIIAGLAAYAMGRLDMPGTNGMLVYLIGITALPVQLFLVPLFYLWSHIHLYNSLHRRDPHLLRDVLAVRHAPAALVHAVAAPRLRGGGPAGRRE